MSVLGANSLRSNSSSFNSPITFETSGGTQNGTLSRAWVNFNGQGAVAIRANFNVNSITDNGVGDFTINFANAMSDANYSYSCNGLVYQNVRTVNVQADNTGVSSGSLRTVCVLNNDSGLFDLDVVAVQIFR